MSYQSHPNPAASDLVVEVDESGSATIIAMKGAADLPGVEILDRKLVAVLAKRPTYVIFDLTQLRAISSICMGSLIRTQHATERTGGACLVVTTPGLVLNALRRARLTDLFKQFESVAEAMASIKPHAQA